MMIEKADREILRPCLWGAAMEFLDLETDRYLIIERILEHGGNKQIEFMLSHYLAEEILGVIRKSSYLSPKTVNYWCLFFNQKREDTKCYSKPSQRLWSPF